MKLLYASYLFREKIRGCFHRNSCHPHKIERCLSNRKAGSYTGLSSFFNMQKISNGQPTSTVFIGTMYELSAMQVLQDSFKVSSLRHTGGAYDGGVDLRGKWKLEDFASEDEIQTFQPDNKRGYELINRKRIASLLSKPENIPKTEVFVQCKAYSKNINAMTIRELSGIYHYNVPLAKQRTTFLFLVAPMSMTEQGLLQFEKSEFPMIFLQLSKMKLKGSDVYDLNHYIKSQVCGYKMNAYAKALLKGINMNVKVKRIMSGL